MTLNCIWWWISSFGDLQNVEYTTSASFPDSFWPGVCPVGWVCRIHWLLLCRGVNPTRQWVFWYDTKQSYGEVPIILELWGMQSIPSLPLLPGPLWPRVVAPFRILSMGQIDLNCVLMLSEIAWNRTVLTFKLVLMLNWIEWNGTVFVC